MLSGTAYGWGQQSELSFIDTIGTHWKGAGKKVSENPKVRKIRLLEGYLTALKSCPRRWWHGADIEELRKRAEKRLAEAKRAVVTIEQLR
jgi:hypothetical protein